ALVEIARGHDEELCRVTEALRTENASLASQLTRLQMQLNFGSQLPSADDPPKPPPPLEMPDAPPPGPPPEVSSPVVSNKNKNDEKGIPGASAASEQQDQGDQSPGREQQQRQRELQGPGCPGRGGAEVEPHGNQAVDLPGTVDLRDKGVLEALPSSSHQCKCKERTAAPPPPAFVLPRFAAAQSQESPEIQMESHGMSHTSNSNEELQDCPSEKLELSVQRRKSKSPVGFTPDTMAIMEDEEDTVQLQLVWKQARASAKRITTTTSKRRMSIGSNRSRNSRCISTSVTVVPHDAERSCCWSCLNSLAMNPGSNKRVAFEVFGLLLILYDLVWWPAQVFGSTSLSFTLCISWLSSAFWACDLIVSFFVGFTIHDQGLIEMRVSKIARHYAMTWLPIDLPLVLLDWTLNALILLSRYNVAEFAGNAFLEKVQYLRLLRLLRLIKATNIIKVLSDRIQSETVRILIHVVKLLVFIMLINHLIACSWYAVGINDIEREDTWVKANDLKGKGTVYAYTTALHWSITQFTPASMEVVPVNELERSFTIVVIVSAMVIFSSFISTITNAMTQLRNLNSERNAELVKLRCFFSDHKVSASLVARISSCIHQSNELTASRVHSEDVGILKFLPASLKCDLAEEVFAPTLCAHPFILTWGEYYPRESKRLFLAARSSSLGAKHELFNTGQMAESMYFLSSGMMVFIRDDRELAELPTFVSPGQWLAEPAMWIKWKHVGHASSTEQNCELVSLHCKTAIRVLSQDTSIISGARRYAKTFAAYFDKQPDRLSDVWADMDVLEALVSEAFIEHERELLNQVALSTGMKDTKGLRPIVRMASRLSGSSVEKMRAAQDEHRNLTALHERISKYSANVQKRKQILGIKRINSDSSDDSEGPLPVPVSDFFQPRDPGPSSIGRETFGLNGLNVVPRIASALRVMIPAS
ncbi:unnamed protein product, partial [Polarella glacialis]